MKKFTAILICGLLAFSLAACGSTSSTSSKDTTVQGNTSPVSSGDDNSGTSSETIALTVWGAEEDQALLSELVAGFEDKYSGYTFDISIGVESESTAKDTVLTDIEAAADVFAFADDQLNELVSSGALAQLIDYDEALISVVGSSLDEVLAQNSESSVSAATSGGAVYAFPFGGGNNFFLYYNSNVVSAEDVETWDSLLAAADAAGLKVGMTLNSGWYNAGFFLGAGFTSDLEADGSTTYIDWNGTSSLGYTGVQVTQAMLEIAGNSAFLAIPDGSISNEISSGTLAAVVSGTWDATLAGETWGDGYAATKLPTYTIGSDQVQQDCYSGFKLMGVNAYSDNIGWAVVLAEYLTNYESQVARFEARELAPTNIEAASAEAVTGNIAIAASSLQDAAGGVVQAVGGNFWDPTASFGQNIADGTVSVSDEAAIQSLLDDLVEGVTAPVE